MRVRDLAVALLLGAALAACGKTDPAKPAPKAPATPGSSGGIPVPAGPEAPEDHSHDPKHGGYVLEIGAHEGHVEIVHDAKAGTLAAYVYDEEMKPVASAAPVVNLTKGRVQFTMSPLSGAGAGPADAWTAMHDGLKATPLAGRLRVKIGDRTYQPDLADPDGK
jgi:hypothetical protein